MSEENIQKNKRHLRRISRHSRMIFRVWVYRQRNSPVQQLLLYLLGLHIIHPCSAQDGESQNAVWLNYYQLSRFERVRPLCRQFVHWAARRVLCKTMFEVSLSADKKSILIIKQIYYQTQWEVHQCIFRCVVYLDIMDFEKIELNSVGISVGCRIAVSRTLQGNFGYFATRKTG